MESRYDQDEHSVGRAIRVMMTNHNRNKPTDRKEIQDAIGCMKEKTEEIIHKATEYIKIFGLEIVKVGDKKEKFFIVNETSYRKQEAVFYGREASKNEIEKQNKKTNSSQEQNESIQISTQVLRTQTDTQGDIPVEKQQLYTLFGLIQAELDKFNSVDILKDCILFKNENIREYLKKVKGEGYIKQSVEDNVLSYSLGWRFYAEYGRFFNMSKFYKIKKGSRM
ncbi:hypothetical protein ECANGB1_507 [Enterospora canceri]|uniref:Uncharacterized protein n=1 Tax=Enterospora canceri TaxID=1081671 RepID=A0A1Y1S4C7_9MICR|nr:hypothetical protein ECANGB1_507 [Enterospora canceri]